MRRSLILAVGLSLALFVQGVAWSASQQAQSVSERGRALRAERGALPDGYVPAAVRARQLGRYFVEMKAPSAADVALNRRGVSGGATAAPTRDAAAEALGSQEGAIAQARSLGGTIVYRYGILVNAFSARLTGQAAAALVQRADVRSVQPVAVVQKSLSTSVPFIGAPQVWQGFGVRGEGMRVSLVDTGIDYTHASFGGAGTAEAYAENDPTVIEDGTFPTDKVIGGFDFVGENYDVLDDDDTNDTPRPDFDPLDQDGHGTHTGSTVAGLNVPGQVGRGVAPKALLYAYKVWDEGNSTDDVLVAAYERSMDPNQDGDIADAVDVISFSGGVSYGTLNSLEAKAAQRVVDLGTVFVASAGNEGHQAVGGSPYILGTPAAARGVVAVAASIDEFVALQLVIDAASDGSIPTLPDNGIAVHQDWSADLPEGGISGDLIDGREVDAATTDPADAMFCDPQPAGSYPGGNDIVLIFKGSTGAGDCDGTTKVFEAQEAGAEFVILVSLFGGLPFGLGPGEHVDEITIPALMISGADGEAILDDVSPNAPGSFNDETITAHVSDDPQVIPGFDDAMTDFTSEGPARLTSDLKPDISAPGFNIAAASVGTGNEAIELSGTSMAAPHVSGVATLLRQLHPNWTPAQIKGALMNQANRTMKNNDLTTPVSATVMGAGRVDAFQSARAVSVAWPGSLSFGFAPTPDTWTATRSFRVKNFDGSSHSYTISGVDRYFDFDPAMTTIAVSKNGATFGSSTSFTLGGGNARRVWVRLSVDPSVVSELEQEFGWYYFHPNMDGTIRVQQGGGSSDVLRLPWHVAPLATADTGVSETALDLTGGPGTFELVEGGVGTPFADNYLLGTEDETDSHGEEDLIAVGARSFTGATIDGAAEGVPTGTDELAGITWQEFLTNDDEPTEPVEFGVQTWGVRNTTETLEVDVFVDAGADGVFADEDLQADFLVAKLPGSGGNVCVFDLSDADQFEDCEALYFADYSNFNTNLTGLPVDASVLGLTDGAPELAYHVEACTGTFSGDVPGFICDSAGEIDDATGTWDLTLNAIDPALVIDPLVCKGFWDGGDCDATTPVSVATESATADDDPSILVLFPNDAPHRTATVITTDT